MKKILVIILFLPFLGCVNIIKNNQTSSDFNCPTVFFSAEDRIYIDNSVSLDNILIKGELNNFAINTACKQQENIAVIPLDILIVAKPMNNLEEDQISFPIYASLLDVNDEFLETQYFSILGSMKKYPETDIFIETDINGRLQIVTKYLETSQVILGFMLNEEKKDLLN